MKKFCFISIITLLVSIKTYSQIYINWLGPSVHKYDKIKEIRHFLNEENIINKAKLLTLSQLGVYHTDSILNQVLAQQCTYYLPDSNYKYMTIVIKNDQPFIVEDSAFYTSKNHDCTYVLVFSYIYERFYLIQGFQSNDIQEFLCDIEGTEYNDHELFFVDFQDYLLMNWNRSLIDFNTYLNKYLLSDLQYNQSELCCRCSMSYPKHIIEDLNNLTRNDSTFLTEIVNKAKLLTLSKYGLLDINTTVERLLNQNFRIDYYKNNGEYLIISIDHNQPFDVDYSFKLTWIRSEPLDCHYRIIYSFNTGEYYKLEGFDSCDFLELYGLTQKLGDTFLPLISEDKSKYNFRGWLKLRCLKKQFVKKKANSAKDCSCKCSEGYSNKTIEIRSN